MKSEMNAAIRAGAIPDLEDDMRSFWTSLSHRPRLVPDLPECTTTSSFWSSAPRQQLLWPADTSAHLLPINWELNWEQLQPLQNRNTNMKQNLGACNPSPWSSCFIYRCRFSHITQVLWVWNVTAKPVNPSLFAPVSQSQQQRMEHLCNKNTWNALLRCYLT